MITPETKVTISLTEPLLICLAALLLLTAWNYYLILSYKKVVRDFFAHDYNKDNKVLLRAQKLQRQMYPSSFPNKKNFRPYYNNVCHILASLALLSEDDAEFLLQLDKVQEGDTYPLKAFTLALYFRSKRQVEFAETHYNAFLSCSGTEDHMRIVMDFLFAPTQGCIDEGALGQAIRQFKNPAIILLLEQNGLATH